MYSNYQNLVLRLSHAQSNYKKNGWQDDYVRHLKYKELHSNSTLNYVERFNSISKATSKNCDALTPLKTSNGFYMTSLTPHSKN